MAFEVSKDLGSLTVLSGNSESMAYSSTGLTPIKVKNNVVVKQSELQDTDKPELKLYETIVTYRSSESYSGDDTIVEFTTKEPIEWFKNSYKEFIDTLTNGLKVTPKKLFPGNTRGFNSFTTRSYYNSSVYNFSDTKFLNSDKYTDLEKTVILLASALHRRKVKTEEVDTILKNWRGYIESIAEVKDRYNFVPVHDPMVAGLGQEKAWFTSVINPSNPSFYSSDETFELVKKLAVYLYNVKVKNTAYCESVKFIKDFDLGHHGLKDPEHELTAPGFTPTVRVAYWTLDDIWGPLRNLPLHHKEFVDYVNELSFEEARLLFRKVSKTSKPDHAITLSKKIISDYKNSSTQKIKAIEAYSALSKALAPHTGEEELIQLNKYILSKTKESAFVTLVNGLGVGIETGELTVKNLSAITQVLDNSGVGKWVTPQQNRDITLEKLLSKLPPVKVFKLLSEFQELEKAAPLTLEQWDVFLQSSEEWSELPLSWWRPLI